MTEGDNFIFSTLQQISVSGRIPLQFSVACFNILRWNDHER